MLALPFAIVANDQRPKCKKWTYDFSEVVKYAETPLDACKNYVKEKYPNDNYRASVEATNDPETYRCSASETYIGVVYQRECETCCKKPTQPQYASRGSFNEVRQTDNGALKRGKALGPTLNVLKVSL